MPRRTLARSLPFFFALLPACSGSTSSTPATDAAPDTAPTSDATSTDVAADLGVTDAPVVSDAPWTDGGALDGSADAVADASTDRGTADAGAACVLTRALVTTSDYTVGGFAVGPLGPVPSLTVSGMMSPDQDHAPVQSGCVVYNLLRGDDALAVLDTANLPSAARTIPLRVASDAGADAAAMRYAVNPYDVLTLDVDRALVVQYQLPRIAVVDPTRGGAAAITGSVDLRPLRETADTDGAPEAMAIRRAGAYVFVGLQNLLAYTPVTNGTVAVLSASDLSIVDADRATAGPQAIRLGGRNPVSMVTTPAGTSLVVAEAGVVAFSPPQALDGRIERIDAATLQITGTPVTETALGGDVGDVVMFDEHHGWALVSRLAVGDAGLPDSRIVSFDLVDGSVGATPIATGDALAGLARDPNGNVWVLDRSSATPGVRVLRPDGSALTTMTLATGRPPTGVAFVP